MIGNNRARASRVGGIKKVVGVTVAQTAPTRLVRVRIFNNLSVYYYVRYGITRYVYLSLSSLASWVKLAFLFSEL